MLGGGPLTGEGLKDLAGAVNLKKLRLRGSQLNDAGWKALAGLSGLEELEIQYTPTPDSGLKRLAVLGKLRTLDLGTTDASDVGVAELQAACPAARSGSRAKIRPSRRHQRRCFPPSLTPPARTTSFHFEASPDGGG